MNIITYFFWPRPDQVGYESSKIVAAISICLLFIVFAFAIKYWRKSLSNSQTRKLSRSWSALFAWFGCIGLVLAVSRAEDISYVSMRVWWLVWGLAALFALFIQAKQFKSRHYNTLPHEKIDDPRMKYLPKKKKK